MVSIDCLLHHHLLLRFRFYLRTPRKQMKQRASRNLAAISFNSFGLISFRNTREIILPSCVTSARSSAIVFIAFAFSLFAFDLSNFSIRKESSSVRIFVGVFSAHTRHFTSFSSSALVLSLNITSRMSSRRPRKRLDF